MAETATETPAKGRPKPKKGRPKGGNENGSPKVITFFQRVAQIAKEDWGTRASIKIYRLEPIINKLVTQDNKYIAVYAEPVDEERVKLDFGSGRYRLYLNYKMPNTAEGLELDSMEFDILDERYPPKISPGEWVDDPKNRKWAWARALFPPAAGAPPVPQAPTGTDTVVEMLGVFNQIQDSATERAKASMPATPAGPTTDPMVTAMSFAKEILAAKADNPMVDMMRDELKAMRDEIRAEREANRTLQTELRQQQNKPATNGFDTFKAIVGEVKTLIPDLKELFPAAEPSRARGPWWVGTLESAIQAVGPAAVPLIQGWVMRQQQAQQPQPHFPQNGALPQATPGIAPPPQHTPLDLDAMLLQTMSATPPRDGGDMAEALNMYFGQQGKIAYQSACALGADGLLNFIKGRAAVWNELGALQSRMPKFIQEFIEWGQPDDAEIVDAETTEVIS